MIKCLGPRVTIFRESFEHKIDLFTTKRVSRKDSDLKFPVDSEPNPHERLPFETLGHEKETL